MRWLYLSGGVGGARLLHGLYRTTPPEALTAIVNVGDDLTHWGLAVSPDVDTVLYTLSELGDEGRGWGLDGETFRARGMVERYGGPTWFAMGDADLGTHLMRTQWLRDGARPTEVTARLADALGVRCRVLPASDDEQRTFVETPEGTLAFQEWLVQRRGEPAVSAVRVRGQARPSPEVLAAIEASDVVLIGPSNPYVSIEPILGLPGVRDRVAGKPVLAVSPIVGGRAVKGPLARMIPELSGRTPSAASVAAHYGELLDGFVLERGDEPPEGLAVLSTRTVMRSVADRERLAREVVAFASERWS